MWCNVLFIDGLTGSAAPPQDTNSNINDERQSNEPLKSSSAADMDSKSSNELFMLKLC